MPEPIIARRSPVFVDLEPGRYAWCSCGAAAEQPFCDGSHRGTGFRPLIFEVERACKCAICACKHTVDEPWCDGTHRELTPG